MQTFNLEGHEFIELHNLLKITGLVGSGGMAKNLIGDGQVTVDEQTELRKRCKILDAIDRFKAERQGKPQAGRFLFESKRQCKGH